MADLEFYQLSMTGAEADSGIRTGMEAGATSGVLLGDGNGGVTAARPGQDFGYPLLTGNGPPTGNTAANIGQHYFDMQASQAPYEYICVGLNANGFIWIVFGDTGNGFKISGYFVSLEALEAAISAGTVAAPTAGTAYGIGEAAPYDIYVWDAVNSDWVNNGPLGASGGGSGVPPHGTTGQVLTKLSDLDGDAGWKDMALKGEGAPTAATVGVIGQLYIDTTATENPAYICVGITTADNVTTYVWQPVGGTIEDGSITIEKLAPAAISELGQSYNYADNSDFTQWIAQAGIGGNRGSQAYGGDRWILDSGTITGTARADGNGYENITLNGVIRQIVANPPAVGTVGVDMISGTAAATYADGEITITSSGGIPKDVWLYEGTYEAGAAPKYQPKGYGAELAECLRYYAEDATPWNAGTFTGEGVAVLVYVYPVAMRTNPTINIPTGTTINVDVYGLGIVSFSVDYAVPSPEHILLSFSNSQYANKSFRIETKLIRSADLE